MTRIDLNCDMGEGIGNEEAILPFVSAANIACGAHAGNEEEMKKVVDLCLRFDVAIGAHPSFNDRENFGRTNVQLPMEEVARIVRHQLEMLNRITLAAGGRLHHVKPHGALYNMAAKDPILAKTIALAIKEFDQDLICYGLSGSVMIDQARRVGLKIAEEVFADRTYQKDGTLTPRTSSGALINNWKMVIQQVEQMINNKTVTAITGEIITIKADTVCIHGDGEKAIEFAKDMYEHLQRAGIQIMKL